MLGSITGFLVGLKLKRPRVHKHGFESRSRKQILKYRRHVCSDLHVREGSKDQWQRSAKEHRQSDYRGGYKHAVRGCRLVFRDLILILKMLVGIGFV